MLQQMLPVKCRTIATWILATFTIAGVLLCVRICVGLFESSEIDFLRRKGIHITYYWEETAISAAGELGADTHFIQQVLIAGILGKSWANIGHIKMSLNSTNEDLLAITNNAVNISHLSLEGAPYSREALLTICNCKRLAALDASYTNVDDVVVSAIAGIESLETINFEGTLVTDDSAMYLSRMSNLSGLNLCYTDVSYESLLQIKKSHYNSYLTLSSERFWVESIVGYIRWSDGEASASVIGPRSVFSIEANVDGNIIEIKRIESTTITRADMWCSIAEMARFGQGDYTLRVSINSFHSKPVIFHSALFNVVNKVEFVMPVSRQEAIAGFQKSVAD